MSYTKTQKDQLPADLYSAAQVRKLDRLAIEEEGIPGFDLMSMAGHVAFDALVKAWPEARSIAVLCGSGNNAGDGYIVAGLARKAGLSVALVSLADTDKLQGDAAKALAWARELGVEPRAFGGEMSLNGEIFVDALLGTGLNKPVSGDYLQAIDWVNQQDCPVLSLDLPSGLNANTGAVMGTAVKADLTVTFVGMKQGLLTAEGPDHCGELFFSDLEIPAAVYDALPADIQRISFESINHGLGRRKAACHKGDFGHLMIIGGDRGMGGAVIMAAESAARCGAGLITVVTRPEHVPAVLARLPEVMCVGVNSGQDLEPLMDKPTAIVLGPGLGQSAWGQQLLQQVMFTDLPVVVDADALNILSAGKISHNLVSRESVICPHPGEAARLLGCARDDVQQERFIAVKKLSELFNGAAILKGVGSLVCQGNEMALCSDGNPGMAVGGMGDVLSGVLGALLAQGHSAFNAAKHGVCMHGAAADRAAGQDQRGLLASDLTPYLRRLGNK